MHLFVRVFSHYRWYSIISIFIFHGIKLDIYTGSTDIKYQDAYSLCAILNIKYTTIQNFATNRYTISILKTQVFKY